MVETQTKLGDEKRTCCICYTDFVGYGHNPQPLKETGRCCDTCNDKVVTLRLRGLNDLQPIVCDGSNK